MRKSNSKKILAFFATIFIFMLFSCQKKLSFNSGLFNNKEDDTSETSAAITPSWHPSQKKVCIVFGYGYNEEDYVKDVVETLGKKYGFDDGSPDSGLIFPLIFPKDFPSSRIMRLSSLIGEERELAGLIIIGAPEKTNQAIAYLEDEWDSQERMIPYPIYAFFSQDDDVAGMEATANFIIDRKLEGSGSSNDESDKEEVMQTQIPNLADMLDRAVEYMLLTKNPLPSDADLIKHVSRIVGKEYSVSRYVDAESGLQSMNHFVIEAVKND